MSSRLFAVRLRKVLPLLATVFCLIGLGVLSGYSAYAQTAPAAPTVSALATGPSTISLSWATVTGATKYNVYRKDGTAYTLLTGTGGTASPYALSGLTSATDYTYAVSASNGTTEGTKSTDVTARTWCLPPTNLNAAVGDHTVYLNWDAPTGARRYTVHRKTVGGTWSTIWTGSEGPSPNHNYTDITAPNGPTYVYRVLAYNGYVFSTPSNEVSATPATAFAAPTNLVASPDYGQVTLNWAASRYASSYKVYWGTTLGSHPNLLGTVSVPTATLVHANPGNGTTFYYVVHAVDANNVESGDSNEAVATTPAWAGPTGVTTTPGNGLVVVSWNADPQATHYWVFRRLGAAYYGYDTGSNVTSYAIHSAAGVTSEYYVRGANDVGRSDPSSVVLGTPAPSYAPTGLAATSLNGDIKLSWTASDGATSYNVYRGTATGTYGTTAVNTAAVTGTTFTDTGLPPTTAYYYVVRSVNANLESGNSNEATATTSELSAPTGLTAAPTATQIGLSWTASPNATSYKVYRGTTSGNYTTTFNATGASYTDTTNLVAGTTYYYAVSALKAGGESTKSAQISTMLLPAAPTGLSATATASQITLSWGAVTGATSYKVFFNTTGSTTTYTLLSPTVQAPTVSFPHSGLTSNTTYYYVVSAVNAAGEGAKSAQFSKKTLTVAAAGLSAVSGSQQITLSWNAVTGATGYRVYFNTTGSTTTYTVVNPTATTNLSLPHTGLTAGTTYYYVVRAVNESGESGNSNQVNTIPLPAVPSVPTGLTATAGNGQVGLSWTATAGATGYKVKRSTMAGGPYTTVGTPTNPSFPDNTAQNGTTYYYVVSATNAGGESGNSQEVSATPAVPLFKKPDALFEVGDGISDGKYAPGDLQQKDKEAGVNAPAIYVFHVQNKGNQADSFYLYGEEPTGWTAHYFDALTGGNDVTADVKAGGYHTGNVAAGDTLNFRVELQPRADANVADGTTQDVHVTATSSTPLQSDGTPAGPYDALILHTLCKVYKPDAMIRVAVSEDVVEADAPFLGNDVYSDTAIGQTITALDIPGQTLSYELRVQNDGPTSTPLTVKLPTAFTGWTVHVYDADNDITAQVLSSTGWQTPSSLDPGAKYKLRIDVTPDLTTTVAASLLVKVIGGGIADAVKLVLPVQSVAGLQYSVDAGSTWSTVPAGGLTVAQWSVVGFRAVKGDPTIEWPHIPDYKPTWSHLIDTHFGETVWIHFPDVTPINGDGEEVKVECGNALSVKVKVLPSTN